MPHRLTSRARRRNTPNTTADQCQRCGGRIRSLGHGRTWQAAGGPPLTVLAWDGPDKLWGVTAAGGSSWSQSGKLAGSATAFAANNGKLYAAVHERGIFASGGGGANWSTLYQA